MKHRRKIMALLLTLSLVLGMVTPVVYAEDTENILEIATAEGLLEFSQMCRYDAYSDGLMVRLMNDIDMTGYEFEDIPIFLGTFDGDGYTISGIESSLEKDTQGLFRHISEGAIVSDLTVLATRETKDDTIGGIAAVNYGTIQNCTYRGLVSGGDIVGGIVGENYGMVMYSVVSGVIYGETQVGGIVGVNEGTIVRSENYAKINGDISDLEFSTEDKLVSSINPNSDTIDITNIGGIAGTNEGILQSSINHGTVGYPHVGYNIGGVAGMQTGYIVDCSNLGNVQGRKEVGGIVGQFEPYIDVLYSISKLQTLRDELNTLSDLTSNMSEDAKNSNELMDNDMNQLSDSIDVSKEYLDSLLEQTGDMVNANVDSVNEISVTVSETLDDMVPIVDSLDAITGTLTQVMWNLEFAAMDMQDALEDLEDLGDSAEEAEGDLSEGMVYLSTALDDIEIAAGAMSGATDLSGILTALSDSSEYLERGVGNLSIAVDYLGAAISAFQGTGASISSANEELQDAMEDLQDAFSNAADMTVYLEETNDMISDLVEDLSEKDEVIFTKFDETYEDTYDSLTDALDQMSDDFSTLHTNANASGDVLIDDMDAVSSQMIAVFDSVIEIMQDVTSFVEDEEYKVEDVSTFDTTEIYAGKIIHCDNAGYIEGDINVGGIVGAISFELSFDMEDDWKFDRDKTQSITRQGVAIVENSTNTGDVWAKKDGAGGIVGYQEFGLVQGCIAGSDVESEEGSYVGGIVGQSTGYIRNSFAKTTLTGTQFVAGIAGSAYDVQGCYSLSAVTATKGGTGGIVGELDTDGILRNNFFVSDTLGGLDGISFKGQAESISYEDLLLVEDLPHIFDVMSLSFYVDDVLLDVVSVEFGGSISDVDLPEMPEKDGYYSRWEDFDGTNITSDLKINGEYSQMLTVLSGIKNEDGVSVLLVDGAFTEDDQLCITENVQPHADILAEYTLWVDGENTEITAIRYLMPDSNVSIQMEVDGKWMEPVAIVDGKYIIIPVEVDGVVEIRVVDALGNSWSVFLVGGVTILLFGGYFVYHKRKSKKVEEAA